MEQCALPRAKVRGGGRPRRQDRAAGKIASGVQRPAPVASPGFAPVARKSTVLHLVVRDLDPLLVYEHLHTSVRHTEMRRAAIGLVAAGQTCCGEETHIDVVRLNRPRPHRQKAACEREPSCRHVAHPDRRVVLRRFALGVRAGRERSCVLRRALKLTPRRPEAQFWNGGNVRKRGRLGVSSIHEIGSCLMPGAERAFGRAVAGSEMPKGLRIDKSALCHSK